MTKMGYGIFRNDKLGLLGVFILGVAGIIELVSKLSILPVFCSGGHSKFCSVEGSLGYTESFMQLKKHT